MFFRLGQFLGEKVDIWYFGSSLFWVFWTMKLGLGKDQGELNLPSLSVAKT